MNKTLLIFALCASAVTAQAQGFDAYGRPTKSVTQLCQEAADMGGPVTEACARDADVTGIRPTRKVEQVRLDGRKGETKFDNGVKVTYYGEKCQSYLARNKAGWKKFGVSQRQANAMEFTYGQKGEWVMIALEESLTTTSFVINGNRAGTGCLNGSKFTTEEGDVYEFSNGNLTK